MTSAPERHPARLLAVLLVAPFLAQADATIANVATPAIRAGLGASATAAQLVIGGYLIAYAVLLITGARLGQTHGYKRLFLAGLAVFGASSLAGGLAPDPSLLVGMRVAQGAGAALMYPQTLTGIQLHFTGRERDHAIGLFTIALAAGAVVGQLAGGALISADIAGASWRPVFLVNVPICAAVMAVALRVLPRDRRHAAAEVRVAAGRGAADHRPQPGLAGLDVGVPGGLPARRLADHLAGPVLAFGDDPLEILVFQRLVLGGHRQPLLARVRGGPLGHGPRLQRPAGLQPEVVVQAAGLVFLHHEPPPPGGLAAAGEIPLAAVVIQAGPLPGRGKPNARLSHRRTWPGKSCSRCARSRPVSS